ncbi:MAG: hypothetical protein H6867_02245 [Rhodospirillales bacterium]|nr:hypothetical protein [Rhodospirillales bacterium]MCB9997008.1 hypothetical protein [Rhodospirillales bacterium]
MDKLGLFIWIIAAPVLMGTFVLAVLLMPSLAHAESKYIIMAAVLGAVVAAPISLVIAKKIDNLTKKT